jgi:hypothetical protein
MARRGGSFKQADVERAIRSAKGAGIEVAVVEVVTADGVTIRVSGKRVCGSGNPWDEVLTDEQDPKVRPPLDR